MEKLELQLGQETVACSALVVGKSSLYQQPHFSSLLPSLLGERGKGGKGRILALSAPDKASPKVLYAQYLCQDSQTWWVEWGRRGMH